MRKKLNPKMMAKLDWTQQDAAIAKQLKISPASAWRWRRHLKKPAPACYRAHFAARKDRSQWDWSLSNIALATRYGMSRQRVHQLRLKFAQPKA